MTDAERKVDLQDPLFTRFGLPFWKFVAAVLLFLLGPVVVRGKYRVPRKGGLLILSNHLADVDPAIIQVACPRPVYFMAKSELFEMRFVGRFIRWFRAFPVKRGEPDRESLRKAIDLSKAGQAVCVFPEGELSESAELQPLKAGVALIARMAGVDVICVGIRGSNRILPYGSLIPRPAFRMVNVEWGEPRHFGKETSAEDFLAWADAQLRLLTAQVND